MLKDKHTQQQENPTTKNIVWRDKKWSTTQYDRDVRIIWKII